MAEIWFFEKPGCINNAKQKRLLRSAGHRVHAVDLQQQPWSRELLRRFFGQLPVSEWFNASAPAVKSGAVDPAALSEQQALSLMVQDPLLIRRPLMRVGVEYRAGFE